MLQAILEQISTTEYILWYIAVGATTSIVVAVIIGVYKAIKKSVQRKMDEKYKKDKLMNELIKKVDKMYSEFENLQSLIIYTSKNQLLKDTKFYCKEGKIPMHTKTIMLTMCDLLHNLPHSNGDVTECKKKLLDLDIEEVN